ncbi:MAG: (Fe-S)-binding protein [Chitinophagaceae bacterium]|jgi:L-lactate dehydrogenase complex protein LldE|nr:(Fe-S)-binding protein [Chitinophagaceae bacterium]MCA6447601.1 (Fe-S)-binding protein [Chitinophagaceae bacterium]
MTTVQLFVPCFIDQLYPNVAFNMVKVLEKAGCTVTYNENQTCCGQPAFNGGFWGEAREVCTKFINDFDHSSYIVAPSASCVGFVKNYYPKLFENSANQAKAKKLAENIYEFSDFLVNILNIENVGAKFEAKATYHDSCAALRECKIKDEPRKLLAHVQGLELVEMQDVETCCGFGGTFAVKFEPISVAMADQKITNAEQTGATHIISTDMSCLMHIDGCAKNKKSRLQSLHLADVLASGW